MATDQMTAQPGGGGQGLFQVDPAADLELGKGAATHGFLADIGPETVTGQFHHGQTDAVHGNAVAQLDVAQVQLAGSDLNPHITAARLQTGDLPCCFDYSGKHLCRSEEHTSELQSRPHLVCRLLLEKKNI